MVHPSTKTWRKEYGSFYGQDFKSHFVYTLMNTLTKHSREHASFTFNNINKRTENYTFRVEVLQVIIVEHQRLGCVDTA